MNFGGRFLKINLYRDLVQFVLFFMLGMFVTQGFKRGNYTLEFKSKFWATLENCTRSISVSPPPPVLYHQHSLPLK